MGCMKASFGAAMIPSFRRWMVGMVVCKPYGSAPNEDFHIEHGTDHKSQPPNHPYRLGVATLALLCDSGNTIVVIITIAFIYNEPPFWRRLLLL
jgi:hypothetical protein